MSDEMPTQIRRQLRDLSSRFLNTALAEQVCPASIASRTFVGGMCFGNCNQLDVIEPLGRFSPPPERSVRAHDRDFQRFRPCRIVGQALRLPIRLFRQANAPPLGIPAKALRRIKYGLHHYLLANRSGVTQKELIMKRYSLLLGFIIAALLLQFARSRKSRPATQCDRPQHPPGQRRQNCRVAFAILERKSAAKSRK